VNNTGTKRGRIIR